jgi:arylsulfatase A-like enzyme
MSARKNILIFFTDDHGQWANGCYGSEHVHSPTIDSLAASGTKLTHAFTPSPVCSPARASFFTGLLPSQYGIHDYIGGGDGLPDGHPSLRDQTTIAQLLQADGYRTGLAGKWHCGYAKTEGRYGFDRWFSYAESQYPHQGPISFMDQDEVVDYDGYQSEAITEQAVKFIEDQSADQPFFLFIGYVDTHTPYTGHPERHMQRYRDMDLSEVNREPYDDCHGTPKAPWPEDARKRQGNLEQYMAAVSMIDEQMTLVIDSLTQKGMIDDTVIVYTADHGHMNGHHGMHCKGNATTPQNFIDNSILVPSIFLCPSFIAEGQTLEHMFDHCDLFNTLLNIADVDAPDSARSPGRSLLPALRGETISNWRQYQFCEYGNARCIRSDTHKLIRRWNGPNGRFPDELYDLQTDPRETQNRIDQLEYADVIATLSDALTEHFDQYDDPAVSGTRIGELPSINGDEPWRRILS